MTLDTVLADANSHRVLSPFLLLFLYLLVAIRSPGMLDKLIKTFIRYE